MIKDRYEINYDPTSDLWCVGHYYGKTLVSVVCYKTKDEAEKAIPDN